MKKNEEEGRRKNQREGQSGRPRHYIGCLDVTTRIRILNRWHRVAANGEADALNLSSGRDEPKQKRSKRYNTVGKGSGVRSLNSPRYRWRSPSSCCLGAWFAGYNWNRLIGYLWLSTIVIHSNNGPIAFHSEINNDFSRRSQISHPRVFNVSLREFPLKFLTTITLKKTSAMSLPDGGKHSTICAFAYINY